MSAPRAALLTLLVALLLTVPASAHALLVRSSPEADAEMLTAPSSIEMWFSEPLETAFTGARLIGPSGEEMPTGATVVDPSDPTHLTLPLGNLGPGIYTVAWQTLSQIDGHEWFGSFPITVLNPDGSAPPGDVAVVASGGRGDLPTAGETITRWLALTGSMLFFGGLVFRQLVVPEEHTPKLRVLTRRSIFAVFMVALFAVILGSLGQLVLQSLRLGGLSELSRLAIETRTGVLVLGRFAISLSGAVLLLRLASPIRYEKSFEAIASGLCLLVAGLLVLGTIRGDIFLAVVAAVVGMAILASAWIGRYQNAALWTSATFLLISFSISSHAGAVQGSLFAVSGDLLHLLAASAWVGGLVLLPIIWFRTRSQGVHEEFLVAVRRFSALAGAAVFIILLTGLFNSFVELPSLQALWTTPYGWVLIAKIALVLIALFLAFLNNRRLRGASENEVRPLQIAIEAGVAALVLIAVSILVQTPTPRSLDVPDEPSSALLPFNRITPTDDLNVHVQVDPNEAGKNRFWVHLYRNDASDIGEVQLVRLFFEHAEQELGRASVDLEALGQDTFAAEGAYISQSGLWDLSVYVRRRGMDDLLSEVRVDVSPGAAAEARASPFGNPIPELAPQAFIGALLITVGLIPILWRRGLTGDLARSYVVGIVLVVVGGVALVLGVTRGARAEVPLLQRTNPTIPTSDSIALGEAMYIESCLLCHGATGLGDGPLGVTLTPRPPNLAVHMVTGVHTDGQILEWITNGFPNSQMPAFGETYSEDEIWNLINFIRTLAAVEEE